MHYCSKLFQKIGLIEIGPFCLFLCSLNRTVAVLQEVKKSLLKLTWNFWLMWYGSPVSNGIKQPGWPYYKNTSFALPGFPGDLEHWLNLRGGNVIQKYLYTPNFSPIGQLEAEIWHFGPNLDHIFGPSSETLEQIKTIAMYNLPIM